MLFGLLAFSPAIGDVDGLGLLSLKSSISTGPLLLLVQGDGNGLIPRPPPAVPTSDRGGDGKLPGMASPLSKKESLTFSSGQVRAIEMGDVLGVDREGDDVLGEFRGVVPKLESAGTIPVASAAAAAAAAARAASDGLSILDALSLTCDVVDRVGDAVGDALGDADKLERAVEIPVAAVAAAAPARAAKEGLDSSWSFPPPSSCVGCCCGSTATASATTAGE